MHLHPHHRPGHPLYHQHVSPSPDTVTGVSVTVQTVQIASPPPPIPGRVVAGGRGAHAFYLDANGIRDWALIPRNRGVDKVWSIGSEDRIGILGAKRVRLSGDPGRISIRDHRGRRVGIIRDTDITLAQAREMVCALPQGWPV